MWSIYSWHYFDAILQCLINQCPQTFDARHCWWDAGRRTGEIAPHLRTLAVLAKDSIQCPAPKWPFTVICHSISRGIQCSLLPLWVPGTHVVCRLTHRQKHSYTWNKINTSFKIVCSWRNLLSHNLISLHINSRGGETGFIHLLK